MPFTNFQETLAYLYDSLPMFQRVGAPALKPDLRNTLALCGHLKHPENKFRSIHVAGTNGKGSTSHMLASILQSAGYETGLYTSPHLKSFTERIRVNGAPIAETAIVDFVNRMQAVAEEIKPSFFELTTAMAFDYFAGAKVDFAVIETGLGGRLDSTNVITPLLSVITNVGMDHKMFLGDTLPKIASEKAGIIKAGIPVVVSERQPEIQSVFEDKANALKSGLLFASDTYRARFKDDHLHMDIFKEQQLMFENVRMPLLGEYQTGNVQGVVACVDVLRHIGINLSDEDVKTGLEQTVNRTHLKGRWQILSDKPLIICDTGHNTEGIREVMKQLRATPHAKLWIVWGMVRDKDLSSILGLLPKDAYYFFCAPDLPRALPVTDLYGEASKSGLEGEPCTNVREAIIRAKRNAQKDDLIFIGGSTFVVAEVDEL